MTFPDPAETISEVCHLLSEGHHEDAGRRITSQYPFSPQKRSARNYTPRQMTRIFVRDKFQDRYRGTRLVFPAALRVLSWRLPMEFPYHKNGKMDVGHPAYWELFPTIDHLIPIARGGEDVESNWVCCSMLTNSIKANWTVEQLGWTLCEPPDSLWDGMLGWFLEEYRRTPELGKVQYLKTWYSAAVDVLEDGQRGRNHS